MKIHLSAPELDPSCSDALLECLDSGWIAPSGPHIDQFEALIAEKIGAKHAIAVNSGTAAIHLALILLDIGPGDEVLCSNFTFVASANPILYQGAKPIFIDIDPQTWHVCPNLLEEFLRLRQNVNKRLPRALILPHIYGACAPIKEITEICKRYNIVLIEDAAEALGANYENKPVGSFGELGTISFNGNKIITNSAGGLLVTDNEIWAVRARKLISQARTPGPFFDHTELGYNYRMSNILAALGCAQMKSLRIFIENKKRVHEGYKESFKNDSIIQFMPVIEGCEPNYWLTTVLFDMNSEDVFQMAQDLCEQGIEVRSLWKPLYFLPMFQGTENYGPGHAEELFKHGLCLPSSSSLKAKEIEKVVEMIKKKIIFSTF